MAKIKAEYYIAYNFNDKEFDPWFESNQTIYSTRKLDKNNLPIFFRIPVDNPPQILNDRVREFQGNSLSETFVSESIKLFKQKIEDALKQVRKEIEKSNMDKIWNAVADGISQCVFDDGGNPRLPIKPSLKRYLEDAFMKTAPGWLKLPFVLKLAYRSVKELFKRSDKQKTTLAFQGMILTPKKLSDSFRVVRTWPERNRPNDSEFDAASEKIINNINNKIIFLSDFADDSNLNKEEHEGKKKQIEDFKKELEKACDSVWKSIPNQQKIMSLIASVIILISLLSAALMVPIDAGFTAAHVLVEASIPELIAATVVGGVGGSVTQLLILNPVLNKYIFLPYASDFYAISCDALNIPRPPTDKLPKLQPPEKKTKKNYPTYPLQDSKISKEESNIRDWVYWLGLNDQELTQIESSLTALLNSK